MDDGDHKMKCAAAMNWTDAVHRHAIRSQLRTPIITLSLDTSKANCYSNVYHWLEPFGAARLPDGLLHSYMGTSAFEGSLLCLSWTPLPTDSPLADGSHWTSYPVNIASTVELPVRYAQEVSKRAGPPPYLFVGQDGCAMVPIGPRTVLLQQPAALLIATLDTSAAERPTLHVHHQLPIPEEGSLSTVVAVYGTWDTVRRTDQMTVVMQSGDDALANVTFRLSRPRLSTHVGKPYGTHIDRHGCVGAQLDPNTVLLANTGTEARLLSRDGHSARMRYVADYLDCRPSIGRSVTAVHSFVVSAMVAEVQLRFVYRGRDPMARQTTVFSIGNGIGLYAHGHDLAMWGPSTSAFGTRSGLLAALPNPDAPVPPQMAPPDARAAAPPRPADHCMPVAVVDPADMVDEWWQDVRRFVTDPAIVPWPAELFQGPVRVPDQLAYVRTAHVRVQYGQYTRVVPWKALCAHPIFFYCSSWAEQECLDGELPLFSLNLPAAVADAPPEMLDMLVHWLQFGSLFGEPEADAGAAGRTTEERCAMDVEVAADESGSLEEKDDDADEQRMQAAANHTVRAIMAPIAWKRRRTEAADEKEEDEDMLERPAKRAYLPSPSPSVAGVHLDQLASTFSKLELDRPADDSEDGVAPPASKIDALLAVALFGDMMQLPIHFFVECIDAMFHVVRQYPEQGLRMATQMQGTFPKWVVKNECVARYVHTVQAFLAAYLLRHKTAMTEQQRNEVHLFAHHHLPATEPAHLFAIGFWHRIPLDMVWDVLCEHMKWLLMHESQHTETAFRLLLYTGLYILTHPKIASSPSAVKRIEREYQEDDTYCLDAASMHADSL